MDYFLLMFPMQQMPNYIQFTNAELLRANKPLTNQNELFFFFGIRLVMALEKRHLTIDEYWETEPNPRPIRQPADYGNRFHMSRSRFKVLLSCFRVANLVLNQRTFLIRRPKVVEMMFNGFSAIDVHDHYRQGSLNMEEG